MSSNNSSSRLYQVPFLITELGSFDGRKRRNTRSALISIGKPAVPALIRALKYPSDQIRWESAKTLGEIKDPAAAEPLVESLEDQDVGVRWVAMDSLIALERNCIEPLMHALTERFESVWLREGAHHILHVLKNNDLLTETEQVVFKKLESMASETEIPWVAEAALQELCG